MKRRRPTKQVAQDLRERGYSSLVRPYITWRKWDRHRDTINNWRRAKRFLRQFLTVRPFPLAFAITLVVLTFHLPATRPTALVWGEVVQEFFTPERAAWVMVGLIILIVGQRLLRATLEAWELRHSDDALLLEGSFFTDSGVVVTVPYKVFMEMAKGGGSRITRIAYSVKLFTIFPGRTSLSKQDALDHSLRTARGMRLVERWQENTNNK